MDEIDAQRVPGSPGHWWPRLALGLAVVLGAIAVWTLTGFFASAVVPALLGGADGGPSGAGPLSLGELTVGQALSACIFVIAVTAMGRRRTGLTLAGTLTSLRLSSPIVLFIVVLPALWMATAGGGLVHPDVDAGRAAWLVALALAIGAGEELVFRGALLSALGGASAAWFSVGVSGVIFGLLHIGNGGVANPLAVTLIVGLPFAYIRIAGGNLLGLTLVHGLIDIVALLHYNGIKIPDDVSHTEQVIQMLTATAIAGAYTVWFRRSLERGDIGYDTTQMDSRRE